MFLTACQSSPPQSPILVEEIHEVDLAKMREQNIHDPNSTIDVNSMTREELTNCAASIVNFKIGTEQLKTEDHILATKKQQLTLQSQQIETLRAKVNLKSKKQIDRFNQRLEQHKAAVTEFNTKVTQLKTKETELHAHNKAFTSDCTKRSYRYSDLLQLDSKLRKAVESGSGTTDHTGTESELLPEKTIEIPRRIPKP